MTDIVQIVYDDITKVVSALVSAEDTLNGLQNAAREIAGILAQSESIGDVAGPTCASEYHESIEPLVKALADHLEKTAAFLKQAADDYRATDEETAARLKAATEQFNFTQSSINNVMQSIGEGLQSAARKQ
ncbi:MAG TPA: hypothetical protein VMT34_07070 [Aggregatilineales bacterium]|nr:hypothetical protein [Aggregatilineales bacterium]